MKSFKSFLTEAQINRIKRLPWDGSPEIGWWLDQPILRMYHGTNSKNLPGFASTGLSVPDPRTGLFSLAFEPFTARAFAVMGGEARFLANKSRSLVVPENQRAVVVFDIPISWIKKNMDPDLGGNDNSHIERLRDKNKYESWDNSDQQYYQLCELRVKTAVPPSMIKGYMIK
jgi:hypothetical protein